MSCFYKLKKHETHILSEGILRSTLLFEIEKLSLHNYHRVWLG